MGLREAMGTGLRKWVTFSGRASRSEYWWFYLGGTLILYGLMLVVAVPLILLSANTAPFVIWPLLIVFTVMSVWINIAFISALVRRLHDRNLSGWWVLAAFGAAIVVSAIGASIPSLSFAGNVILVLMALGFIVVTLLRGTHGDNRYGPDPLMIERPEQIFE
ncbi:MAG: DUF805 domain-containing protein [Pseudomonadota bacterium]